MAGGFSQFLQLFRGGGFIVDSMNTSDPKRLLFLGGVALLLFGILVARWISGWGLVTVHVTDVPLGKVIASIVRQGHVPIETSLDPNKLVSLDVSRVPVAEAIDTLAIRADASWRLVYLAAPTKPAISNALVSLRGSGKLDDWITYFYPQPPFADASAGGVTDPRYLSLSIEGSGQTLPQLLNQAAQKSGVMTAFPKDWDPLATKVPDPNQVRKIIPTLVKSVHGKSAEIFLITERGRRGGGPGEGTSTEQELPAMNPDWIEMRQLAQIEKLPPAQQPEAKKEFQERKALATSMKSLSSEERRAKWQQMMSDPDRMEKMADRRLLRDAKQTAQQRITRAVNYLNNKASIKAAQAN